MRWLAATLALLLGASAHAAPERRLALLVGHPFGGAELTPLRYVANDLERMREVLELLGDFEADDILVSFGEDADEVVARLAEMRARVAAESSRPTLVLFYYSGHALHGELRLGETRLALAEVKRLTERTAASVRLAMLDSCRSGDITRLKGARKVEPIAVEVDLGERQSGLVLITASGANEDAQESDSIQGSFFTHFLTSGLRGAADDNQDGRVTLSEAYGFAYDNVVSTTVASRGGIQHPTYRFDLRGAGDLVLTRLGERTGIVQWPEAVEGHFILFSSDRKVVVAEFDKSAGRVAELGVAAGDYVVKQRLSDHLAMQRLRVGAHEVAEVDPDAMERVAFADDYAKGNLVTVEEVRYGRLGVWLSLGLVGQTFLSAPARDGYFAPLAIARLQLDLDNLLHRRLGLAFDLGIGSSGERTLAIGDDLLGVQTYRVRLTQLEGGAALTYRYPLTGWLDLGALFRLGIIRITREFIDGEHPTQAFGTMTPGIGVNARLRLLEWLKLGAEVRFHYMYFHIDEPMSLAYVDGGLNLTAVLR